MMIGSEGRRAALRGAAMLFAVLSLPALSHAGPRGLRRPRSNGRDGMRAAAADGVGRPDPTSCKPPREPLAYHGGDLVAHPGVVLLFWGPKWTSDAEHLATKAAVVDFFTAVGTSGFACAWREYAVLGQPLAAGTYDGSFVVTTNPPNPLPDGDIQAEIANEIALGHLPARSDDRVYVVLPEKGVVVDGGGETGCGGSNFTFCGYHDVFGTIATRHRYAVLPYPCNSQGFTCFVGATDDPAAALQAVGAHELTETVTDPDDATRGGGGWYNDRTGDENADICAGDACTDTLTVGAKSYAVNPAWSNLARGCITDVPCAVTPECTDGSPGLCVPGTSRASRCALEVHVDPNLTVRKGLPTERVSCADGQPFCDFDGAANGTCTFHVAVCLNSVDPRVPCTQLPIDSVLVHNPRATSADPTDAANALTVLAGLQNADASSTGTVVGSTVSYAPAAISNDACTDFLDVVVPVGSRSVTLKALSGKTKLPAKVKLTCTP